MSEMQSDALIAGNLSRIRSAIADAAIRASRDPADIRLVAVSKNQPVTAVAAAVAAGQHVFGENTVQDAMRKIPHFAGQGLEWHFIGHLQSNKVRHIPGSFSWVHSVDSLKLAERISRLAAEQGCIIHALIEINITGGASRHGIDPRELAPLLESLLKQTLPGLRLRGLMTIGPHPATSSESRHAFAGLRTLCEQNAVRFGLPDFNQLSMGMSGDFTEAIAEGSTLVRIGTALFGERPS